MFGLPWDDRCISWPASVSVTSRAGGLFHRGIPGLIKQGVGGRRRRERRNGDRFPDENFVHNHDEPFLLSMANGGGKEGYGLDRSEDARLSFFFWVDAMTMNTAD